MSEAPLVKLQPYAEILDLPENTNSLAYFVPLSVKKKKSL